MREFRKSKDCTGRYTSFDELREGFGLKSIRKKRPKDEKVLQEKREKFLGTCPVCKSPMKYVSSNYAVCGNVDCKGKNISPKGEEPIYITVIKEFDRGGTNPMGIEIAKNLFE